MKAVIDGGDAPDLILFPQNYEGRDVVARLSVKLDRTVLTNNVDIAVDGDTVTVTTPVFGGNTLVTTTFTGAARTSRCSGRSASRPSRPADAAAEVVDGAGPRPGRDRRGDRAPRCTSRSRRAPSSTRPTSSCRVVVASARPASTR